MSATARILKLRTGRSVKLDDGPKTIALVQSEIWASHMNFSQLAAASGLACATIGNIASGETKHPRLATVARILMALGWSITATEN